MEDDPMLREHHLYAPYLFESNEVYIQNFKQTNGPIPRMQMKQRKIPLDEFKLWK